MKIARLMRTEVITCRAVDALDEAARLMWQHDIGCLPVVDPSGQVIGMVTDRDVCMAAYRHGLALHALPVVAAMSCAVVACRVDDSVFGVERALRDHQLRRMPVLDHDDRLVGIISLNDLARAIASDAGVSAREVASTLAAISAPRSLAAREV
jgi:CBS domain-containing protein